MVATWAFLNPGLFMGKNTNPSLNKAAVGPDTPYIVLGMGCFWGSEKRMKALPGVLDVESGYAGGDIPNPNYESLHDTEAAIQAGQAIINHAEVVKVYYDPKQTRLEQVLAHFWESHNPTQGNRQGNDRGSNYRSAIFYRSDGERQLAEKTRAIYQANLAAAGVAKPITTEIAPLRNYAPAEAYHQDYLDKNPLGYCGLGGIGVAYADPDQPQATPIRQAAHTPPDTWQTAKLHTDEQLIAFEAVDCGYCKQFDKDVLAAWQNPIPIVPTYQTTPPSGWTLKGELFGTPTIVLFRNGQETARYTGYQNAQAFWAWLKEAAPAQSH